MPDGYHTKQKRIVLSCLAAWPYRAMSAKDVYTMSKANGTPVGLATVYRQLDCLAAENKAQKVISEDNRSVRFQYMEGEKGVFHIKCDVCGKIAPVGCSMLEDVANHMGVEHGFKIDAMKSVLYGRCKDCV